MSAVDLGLPANGKVTLVITGAISFSGEAVADENGNVSFEVPVVETNSAVTLVLSVLDANGRALFIGRDTQIVSNSGKLEIKLFRQFWTLTPGCIAVSATSCSLLYDSATWTTDSTTLSVTGLENAPAGSTFSYEWKDESGTVLSTDPTLTKTAYELLNGTAPADDVTRTFTVTVFYTDESGAAVNVSASADIAVGGPVTIPAFSISLTPPDSRDAASTATSFALTNLDDPVSFTPVAAGGAAIPAGTVFSWTVTMDGHTASRTSGTGASAAVSLAQLGYNDTTTLAPVAAAPKEFRVSCTASNTRATATVDGTDGSADVYLLYTIPDFTVTVSPPAAPHYDAAKSDAANKIYALADLTGAFSFTPVPAAGTSFPTGTLFEWTVTMGGSSASRPDTTIIASCTASPSLIGLNDASIGRTSGTATAISVTCRAKNPHAADKKPASNSDTTLASAFLLYTLPAFTISVSLDTAGYNAANSDLTGTDPLYALVDMGKDFILTATPGSGSFPDDTEFEWTVRGTTLTGASQKGRVITISPAAMGLTGTPGQTNSVSTAKNSPTGISISCTAKHAGAVADVDGTDKTVNVYRLAIPAFKITVTKPDGIPSKKSGSTTKYLVNNDSLVAGGKKFTLKAEPVNSTDEIPDGTKFSWNFFNTPSVASSWTTPSTADNPIQKTAGAMCGGITEAPASQTSYTIYCTASLAGAIENEVTVDTSVVLAPLSVTMKKGSDIGGVLRGLGAGSGGAARSFTASASPPPAGTNTKLSADDSDVVCYAWRDGTEIKYYAEGYTDSGVKIPLHETSNSLFSDCKALTSIDVSGFDTSRVTNLGYMFNGCEALTSITGLSSLNTSKVWSMRLMFYDCKALATIDLSGFNTATVYEMDNMFNGCKALTGITGLTGFDTSKVTNMGGMFSECKALTSIDVSSFDTSRVTNMSGMFSQCSELRTIYASTNFTTTAVTASTNVFYNCTKLRGGNGTTYNSSIVGAAYVRIDGNGGPGYFTLKP